jgi:hypothetical protein
MKLRSNKLQQNTKDRNRKMGLKGDIEALADARRALKKINNQGYQVFHVFF